MKLKIGKCIDCGPESQDKPLIAKRCNTHYWQHRKAVSTEKVRNSAAYADNQAQKKALDLWFANAISQMPACCEECNERLYIFAPWAAKAFVAHVLPKAIFESVNTHPLNKIYLCLICHTNFDTWGEEKVVKMKIFPEAFDIMMQLLKHLHHDEWKSLPEYVKDHINNVA